MKEILILFSFRSHKHGYIERLFDRLEERATKFELHLQRGSLSDMRIQIIDGHLSITESLTNRSLDKFDAIYFELWHKAQQQALAVALFASRHKVPFFSREVEQILPMTKLGELARLADSGIAIPDSFISSQSETLRIFKEDPPLSFPCIMKSVTAMGGNKNFLVHDQISISKVYDTHPNDTFVLQNFIPNDCDYRCLVLGGEIQLVLRRTRTAGTHLNNTSRGAEGRVMPINTLAKKVQADVVRAATILGRQDFAGVDVLCDKHTNRHYILEVNPTPQIEIGVAIEQKMDVLLTYIQSLVKGKSRE